MHAVERRRDASISPPAAHGVPARSDEQPGTEHHEEGPDREPLLADSWDVDLEGPDMKKHDVMWLLRALRDVIRELVRKVI